MISLLLLNKIIQLLIMMALGFLIVKIEIFQSEESRVLSKLCLYLFLPIVIINSFQMSYSFEIAKNLLLAIGVSIFVHVILIGIGYAGEKCLHMSKTEQGAMIYTNVLITIPIISSVLGTEWVVYSSAFLAVQQIFIWTHGTNLFTGKQKISIKKILTNINIIAVLIGGVMFVSNLRFPRLLEDTLSSMGDMVGPSCMLVTGMLLADADFSALLKDKRIYLTASLRMIVCPALILLVLWASKVYCLVPDGKKVLMVTYLAVTSPASSTIIQFAQIHENDVDHVTAITIVTTLVCIVTMPAFIYLYELL